MSTIRTRFAPSPTGFLHVGSARTALYSYLYAKKHRGTFILRIEDTDLERSTAESVQAILDGMAWLNLPADEGPFYQTHRFDRYLAVAKQLVDENKAYRCYCSKERLENLRNTQIAEKQKPRYDGFCRHRQDQPADQSFVIRFANPLSGEVNFEDAVHGLTTFQNAELDDLIIVRSDGSPTYNFTVVVDDWDMQITHVIRGDDHLNNTPRQINILHALGASIPAYAHIPMILGPDGKRLSKRHGAVSVMQYRDEGYLPHALLNYLIRLGWSHGDQEIFSLHEMIELFDLNKLNKSAAAFNVEKLRWLNQHYLKNNSADDIAKELAWHMQKLSIDITQGPALADVVILQRERCKTLSELAERSRFFYEFVIPPQALIEKYLTADIKPALIILKNNLNAVTDWTDEVLQALLTTTTTQLNIKLGDIAQPVRVMISGSTVSPPLNSTLRVLGKSQTLERFQRFVD